MKLVLRVSGTALDSEVDMLIAAALADMARVGIRAELLEEGSMSPLVKQAVACYCKANFGFDNDEAERLDSSYRQCVADLLNSTANEAAE